MLACLPVFSQDEHCEFWVTQHAQSANIVVPEGCGRIMMQLAVSDPLLQCSEGQKLAICQWLSSHSVHGCRMVLPECALRLDTLLVHQQPAQHRPAGGVALQCACGGMCFTALCSASQVADMLLKGMTRS